MYLENLVFDAVDPRRLGRFWESALGTTTLTDRPEEFETRLTVDGGPVLDLCFQSVARPATSPPRLHLDLAGGAEQESVVQRLLGLGATTLDIGQGDVPWVVLADLEGHPFCVMEERPAYRDTGPLAALPFASSDPQREAAFWADLSGWVAVDGAAPFTLRHPSGKGVNLEFFPEQSPKQDKNQVHLDLRLEAPDDPAEVLARAEGWGATTFEHDWGDLPWTVLTSPGGNELCLLRARAS